MDSIKDLGTTRQQDVDQATFSDVCRRFGSNSILANQHTCRRDEHWLYQEVEDRLLSGDLKGTIPLIVELLNLTVEETFRCMQSKGLLFFPPSEAIGHVYLGSSLVLAAHKIGFTTDLTKRQKSLNASMTTLGLAADFELLDYIRAPKEIAQRYERKAHADLAHIHKSGEWFGGDGEAFEWMFENKPKMHADWGDWLDQYRISNAIGDLTFSFFERKSDERAICSLLKALTKWLEITSTNGLSVQMDARHIWPRPSTHVTAYSPPPLLTPGQE